MMEDIESQRDMCRAAEGAAPGAAGSLAGSSPSTELKGCVVTDLTSKSKELLTERRSA